MEPCQFCGQYAPVDGAGFCTNCRNFRGTPAAPVSAPGYPTGDPYASYPTSGPSYGGQASAPPYGQSSAPPVTGAPYLGPTGYPATPPTTFPPQTSYAPAYAAAPPPPPTRERGVLVGVFAVCGVILLAVIAIVVVVVVRNGGDKGGGSTTAAGFDTCLVGTWRVTSYETHVAFDNVGDVTFTADDLHETIKIERDGSAVDDYGTASNPTVLTGSSGSHDYRIEVFGTVSYKIGSANGVLSFSDAKPSGSLELFIDDASAGSENLDVTNDPTPYTCSGGQFTQTTSDFKASATKTSG
jgi:hypothetical protein